MLKTFYKGFKIAVMGAVLCFPIFAQPINDSSFIDNGRNSSISLSINEISVEDAVKMVCEHFGLTPMIHMPLENTISIDFSNVSLEQAMDKILDVNSSYMIENKNLHVFRQRRAWNQFSDQQDQRAGSDKNVVAVKEPDVTRIVPLGKRAASDIHKLLKDLNLNINTVYDSPTNSLIFMGPESQVATAESLCRDIDSMQVEEVATDTSKIVKGMKFITQTYELEHADFDELEEELQTIIDRDSNSNNDKSSSGAGLRDADGNPIETEYFLLDKSRRIVIIHTSLEKFAVVDAYFKAINKPLPQVLIEASIVALDDGLEKQLGIKWNGFEGNVGYTGPTQSIPTTKSLTGLFKYGGTWNFNGVQALLKAVESDNRSQLLSKPRIMTLTGKTSSIHIGDEIPYRSGTTVTDGGNTTSTIAFKEVGIKLDVTPTVNIKDNTIQMKVIPEVSQWVRDVQTGNGIVPQISTRRAESTIKIENGQTIVIGGLIENKSINDIYKLPILGSLPLIGKVFRSKNTTNTKTNLIILLTAHISDNNGTVAKNAINEINEINPLKDSLTLKEISKPLVDNPEVYGKDVVWPKVEESVNEEESSKVENNKNYISQEERQRIIEELKKRYESERAKVDYDNHREVRNYLRNRLENITKRNNKE